MPDASASTPRPPRFHWIFVLILEIVTLGVFGSAWAIVQALWAKKIDRSNRAVSLYVIAIVLSVVGFALDYANANMQLQVVIQVAAALVATFGAFSVKNILAGYATRVTGTPTYLSGLMTIFFGEVYLQYHMNRVLSIQQHAAPASAR